MGAPRGGRATRHEFFPAAGMNLPANNDSLANLLGQFFRAAKHRDAVIASNTAAVVRSVALREFGRPFATDH
jgi:hypothetical protein